MKTWVRKSIKVGILSAGFLLVGGAAAAQAANAASTSDNFGVGNGNQVQADVLAPINVTGNAIGLLGGAQAHGGSAGAASASASGGSAGTTAHNFGILGGNQLGLALLAPVNVSGNAIGVGGTAQASGGSAASASVTHASTGAGSTAGNFGILGGNQISPVVAIPIDVSGNAIGALGSAHATGHSNGAGAMVLTPHVSGGGTSGNFGIGNGNQVTPLISIPIDICGNAVGAFGTADASCGNGGGTTGGGNGGGYTGGGSGSGSGGGYTGGGSGGSTGGGYTGGGSGSGTGNGGYGNGNGGYGTGTGSGTGSTGGSTGGTTGGAAGSAVTGGASTDTTTGTRHAHKAKAAKAAKTRGASDESVATRLHHHSTPMASHNTSTDWSTAGSFGILGGNQIGAVVALPVSVFSNAIAALGTAAV